MCISGRGLELYIVRLQQAVHKSGTVASRSSVSTITMVFNLLPSNIVVMLAIAGIGAVPFGLRWLVEGVSTLFLLLTAPDNLH